MDTKKRLREQRDNAEERAMIHFRKLNRIESIIRVAKLQRTPSVLVVDKIEEVISSDQTNK